MNYRYYSKGDFLNVGETFEIDTMGKLEIYKRKLFKNKFYANVLVETKGLEMGDTDIVITITVSKGARKQWQDKMVKKNRGI